MVKLVMVFKYYHSVLVLDIKVHSNCVGDHEFSLRTMQNLDTVMLLFVTLQPVTHHNLRSYLCDANKVKSQPGDL